MEEIWKDITGYEGTYQISNFGNIKSLKRETIDKNGNRHVCLEKILKVSRNIHGYYATPLYKDYKVNMHTIHRLVATHFIDNPMKKPFINHINGVRDDNRIENLEWVNQRENISHGKKKVTRTSSFIGVYKAKAQCQGHKKLWNSAIGINGKRIRLGNFYTEQEAKEAYQKALTQYGIENSYAA